MSAATTAPALPDAIRDAIAALESATLARDAAERAVEYASTWGRRKALGERGPARHANNRARTDLTRAICDALAAADTAGEARGRAGALADYGIDTEPGGSVCHACDGTGTVRS